MSQCKCIAGLLLKPALLPVWRFPNGTAISPGSRLAQRLFGKFAAAKSAPNPNPPHSLFTASENKDNEK